MSEQNKKLDLKKNSDEKSKIVELLEENLKVSRQILKLSQKTQRWIVLQKIKAVIYFILIIAPIILAAIYLPPILSGLLEQYQELLGIFPNK
ncbi:hypothetical protein KAI52_00800 [Candidatus Parcubacteria bacterium]|nr:hypothetical protein [Candidatus Parcubacteria bacterium]